MKGLSRKIENIFLAITFAEAGEVETAREYMREEEKPRHYCSLLEKAKA